MVSCHLFKVNVIYHYTSRCNSTDKKKKHSFKLFSYNQLRNEAIQPKQFKMFEFRWSMVSDRIETFESFLFLLLLFFAVHSTEKISGPRYGFSKRYYYLLFMPTMK